MRNRRVFQRADCRIAVVAHVSGRFLYGEIIDLSLGGVRVSMKGELDAKKLELAPNKSLPDGMVVIPLPYDVRWTDGEEAVLAGLQFAGGTDAFFRGWLSDYLNPLMSDYGSLLDVREVVRVPCQLEARMSSDEEENVECAVLDMSLGGLSFVVAGEMLPGMSVEITLQDHPNLGSLELILLRVQSLTGHSLCGGKFLEPDEKQVEALQHLVEILVQKSQA